ncbi:MACROD [Acanthosepion pharaonis]|uniref:MACROD n=1 Tax=Acanthosepion pharaonis TaxID=158019 RepID=A0A812C9D5_ACAPH|nr:MACROD [Sepia pharaonis]
MQPAELFSSSAAAAARASRYLSFSRRKYFFSLCRVHYSLFLSLVLERSRSLFQTVTGDSGKVSILFRRTNMETIKTFLCKLISYPVKDTEVPETEKEKSLKKRKRSLSDLASTSKKPRLEYCERRQCHSSTSSFDFNNWVVEKEKNLKENIEERKARCNFRKCTLLKSIDTWTEYYSRKEREIKDDRKGTKGSLKSPCVQLNNKVSIWKGDITSLVIDAIVNAANESLMGGGGVDGAIHSASGKFLKQECMTLRPCLTGQAVITGGYDLPAKYVIHTVGPRGEDPDKLRSCYENSLKYLLENELKSIAFPCVSTGIYGYPNDKAAEVVLKTVREWLEKNNEKVERVIFCLFLEKDIRIYEEKMQLYFPIPSNETGKAGQDEPKVFIYYLLFQGSPLLKSENRYGSTWEIVDARTHGTTSLSSLDTCGDQEEIDKWVITCDSDHNEGSSKALFELNKNGNGLFHGHLSTKLPKDGIVKDAGYVNLRSPRLMKSFKRPIPYDLSRYTHLVLRVRGDGRTYMLNFQMDMTFDIHWDDVYNFALYTRGGPYWQVAKIPFSRFYRAFKGRVQDKQDSLILDKIAHFGITLGDGNSGCFQLEIDYIGAMYDMNHEEEFAWEMYKAEPYTVGV